MKNKKFQYVISKAKRERINTQYPLKSGFLLIEIMTALIAFTGLAVLIARYQVSIIGMENEMRNYLQAVNMACDILEDPLSLDSSSGFISSFVKTTKRAGDNYNESQFIVKQEAQDFNIPALFKEKGLTAFRLKKFKLVTIELSWNVANGSRKSITIKSAKTYEDVA